PAASSTKRRSIFCGRSTTKRLTICATTPTREEREMAGRHPAVAQTFFSFLPHFCHSLRKPEDIVPLTPAQMDPGFFYDTGVVLGRNAAKTGLQDILDRVLARRADLKRLRFALVDLTTDLFPFPQ